MNGIKTKMRTGLKTADENAVSEAIGYILIFTITVIGIAMITVFAYPLLIQSQAHADEISAEQALITLQNDFRALLEPLGTHQFPARRPGVVCGTEG